MEDIERELEKMSQGELRALASHIICWDDFGLENTVCDAYDLTTLIDINCDYPKPLLSVLERDRPNLADDLFWFDERNHIHGINIEDIDYTPYLENMAEFLVEYAGSSVFPDHIVPLSVQKAVSEYTCIPVDDL